MQENYTIGGMTCGGCVRSVERALRSALPDAQIQVSLQNAAVTISGDHDSAVVERAVEDAGFDFVGAAVPGTAAPSATTAAPKR